MNEIEDLDTRQIEIERLRDKIQLIEKIVQERVLTNLYFRESILEICKEALK